MDEYHNLPTIGYRKDRWVSIKHPEKHVYTNIEGKEEIYSLPMVVIEHWTSSHPDNDGVYLTEYVYS